jgi:hypothetical protein
VLRSRQQGMWVYRIQVRRMVTQLCRLVVLLWQLAVLRCSGVFIACLHDLEGRGGQGRLGIPHPGEAHGWLGVRHMTTWGCCSKPYT